MKLMIGLAISAILSVLLHTLVNYDQIDASTISTLFAVVGVVFSVGMSLIISISTTGIKNRDAKNVFRSQLSKIRTRFVKVFVILSLMYVLVPTNSDNAVWVLLRVNKTIIGFDNRIFLTVNLFLSIIYYIVNFYSIQTSVYEIEDRIDGES